MKVSELIAQLEAFKAKHGDVPVATRDEIYLCLATSVEPLENATVVTGTTLDALQQESYAVACVVG